MGSVGFGRRGARPTGGSGPLHANGSELPFRYYHKRLAAPDLRFFAVPCSLEECSRYEAEPTAEDQARLAADVGQPTRLWLVKRWWGNWKFDLEDALGTAARCFNLRDEQDVGGVVVALFERSPACSVNQVVSRGRDW
ncbi:MAG: hypothetical protein M3N29_10885 [Chloroflexota bacterium]|nr:hypothetical protein [Chloroflexota bacterium]